MCVYIYTCKPSLEHKFLIGLYEETREYNMQCFSHTAWYTATPDEYIIVVVVVFAGLLVCFATGASKHKL